MRHIFVPDAVTSLRERIARVHPESIRVWGTMTPAQALAHCAVGIQMVLGEVRPRRSLMGRILGRLIKPLALGNDEPFRRNTSTATPLVIRDHRELADERDRLNHQLDRLVAAGPACCTTHPHAFFGRLTPEEWSILAYKHLDHHLRQFSV